MPPVINDDEEFDENQDNHLNPIESSRDEDDDFSNIPELTDDGWNDTPLGFEREKKLDDLDGYFKNLDGFKLQGGLNVSSHADQESYDFIQIQTFDQLLVGMTNITDDGGIKKKIERVGNGRRPSGSAKVWVSYQLYPEFYPPSKSAKNSSDSQNYNDFYENSTKNRPVGCATPKNPLSFKLCDYTVLPFFQFAVATMEEKEIGIFIVADRYAFGPLGVPDLCPPRTRVKCRIELLEFLETCAMSNLHKLSPQEINLIGYPEISKGVAELKLDGNFSFRKKSYSDAIHKYKRAVNILLDLENLEESHEKSKNEELFKIYSNLAGAYIAIEKNERGILYCTRALELPKSGSHAKIYYRLATAYEKLDDLDKAVFNCSEALRIQPTNGEIQDFYKELVTRREREGRNISDKEGTRDLYEKMASCFFKNEQT